MDEYQVGSCLAVVRGNLSPFSMISKSNIGPCLELQHMLGRQTQGAVSLPKSGVEFPDFWTCNVLSCIILSFLIALIICLLLRRSVF